MRKLYNSLLFFTFIFVISSLATEEISKSIITVKAQVSRMDDVMGVLKLHSVNLTETAFFFDFDETLATTVATHKDYEFRLLPCPDRIRTYKKAFSGAFQNSSFNLIDFDLMSLPKDRYSDVEIEERYEVLDGNVNNLVCELCENACFVGVCSALPGNDAKKDLMKYVGLSKESYLYAQQGKPQAIYVITQPRLRQYESLPLR
jgi:hypothetical protein